MSVFYAHKRQKKLPTAVFSLKNEKEVVIKVKRGFEPLPYNVMKRNTYLVPMEDIDNAVSLCLEMGLYIECIPEQVEKALSIRPKSVFDTTFKKTKLYNTLFPYQKIGIEKVVRDFDGRALIADDMGLGKTLQAIALSEYYKIKKLLVICPAYLRYNWKAEFEKWLGITEVCMLKTGKDELTGYPVITSYELAVKKKVELLKMGFDMVICDESHYLKNHRSQRTRALSPLLKDIRYTLLLTGTPALNRPCELYAQAHIVQKEFFPSFKQYAERYCDRKMSPLGYWDDTGSSNPHEVHWLATKTVMIRRLKRDVLKDLPVKNRSQLHIELGVRDTYELIPLFQEWKELNEEIPKMVPCSEEVQKADFRRKAVISELYLLTSECKAKAIKKLIKDTIQNGNPFLVFCYHKGLMDAIEEVCDGKSMRIDGDTPTEKRHEYVQGFQDGKYQVAVLSMLAAGTGITLTRASHVIFAELYWTPGVLLQSEDRVHRIGQKNACSIQYVICENTLDPYMYKSVQFKLNTIDGTLDQRSDRKFKGTKSIYDMI